MDELVHREEKKVSISPALEFWDIKFNSKAAWCIEIHCELSAGGNRQEHEDSQVH